MYTGKLSARKLKRWTIIAAIALGSLIATLLLGNVRLFQWLHLKAGDLHFIVRGKRPTSNIVVIAVDKTSLEHFKELMMFWHPYYAEAIRAAAEGGAKVLGLDIHFVVDVKKWEPENDALLAQAVAETAATMPVICAYAPSMNSTQEKWPVPVNMIAAAFNRFGFANLTSDPDDFIRNQELIGEPAADGQFYRGLALRVAETFRGVDTTLEGGRLMWAGRAIPITPSRTIAINYAGPPRTFPFIHLSDFIEAVRAGKKDKIRQWVGGKAVLLGTDIIDDRHSTPFYTAFSSLEYNTAGVEIQANTLRTLLDGDYIVPVSAPVRVLALALAAAITALVAASLPAAQVGYWLAASIAATALLTHWMFRAGVMISTSELYLAGLISLLSSTIFRFLSAEKRGSFFQNAISVFVGKKFAATISEEQRISLSGSRQLVTILFSDIRGFTAFCEEKDPAVVVDLLNEYMGGMVKIIVAYHGNVNKFIGDGILAIFSDEDGTVLGDHALRAVRCGAEMVQLPGRFKTGVGIHTGLAVVGNVGSQDKMEYTVLGDTVNLASRLESLNKEMKTQLILSEATRELLDGQLETVYLGDVPIRGQDGSSVGAHRSRVAITQTAIRNLSGEIMNRVLLGLLLANTLLAQPPKKEEPVGLVLLPGGAKLLRAGVETPLAAKSGDILFAGDAMKTESTPANFLYCPSKSSQALAPAGDVLFGPAQLKLRAGKLIDSKPMASCFLPQVVRVAVASQQHYGVSMTRGLTDPLKDLKPTPSDQWPSGAAAEVAVFDKALAADPNDQAALVGRAAVYEKYKLMANALADYKKIGDQWKEAVWVKGKIFELSEALADSIATAAAATPAGGQTFAVLIGVSQYQRLPKEQWLQFADADAVLFEKHILSPRGGGVPPENVLRLTNEKATTAALRNAFQTFLKGRATKNDTVLILIAGHGTVEVPGSKGAFILTHDSDPQDLSGTALPMADLQTLINEELSKVGRVAIFVDVCRAGNIGSITSKAVNGEVEKLGTPDAQILTLMASRPNQLSYEGPEFGGGHGAFSYYLLKALEGAADEDKDGKVDVGELIHYVSEEVRKATNKKQVPQNSGGMDDKVVLSDVTKPGIDLAHAHFPMVFDSGGEPAYLAAAQAPPSTLAPVIARFSEALDKVRLLPDVPDNAFAALTELKNKLTPEQYRVQENRLRVALEDQGQQVILRYLTGDQIPQTQKDFQSGEAYYRAAKLLTPESLFLEGRETFLRGRSLLFDKNYQQAADLLEDAVRIDPGGAHAYNALGIAYLEQADYARAIPAFRDAVHRAPHWTYPLHNLALAYIETGDSAAAIRTYQQAIKLTPQYSYLPYNLGLVYQRLNRRKDAEASYRKAIALAPDLAEPYNALGSLKASTGKPREAEQFYRQALEKNPGMLPARHNLALLLSEKTERLPEAIDLWRDNLKRSPDYLPSRLSLAGALPDTAQAIAEYRTILVAKPDYLAARLALAGLLQKTGDTASALEQLREAQKSSPKNASIYERIGDIEAGQNHPAEARAAYASALENAPDSPTSKRIKKKLKTAP